MERRKKVGTQWCSCIIYYLEEVSFIFCQEKLVKFRDIVCSALSLSGEKSEWVNMAASVLQEDILKEEKLSSWWLQLPL